MEDIYEELQGLAKKLLEYPKDAHWFCPKQNDDDLANYDQPDQDDDYLSSTEKKQHIQDSEQRQKCAYRFTISMGLSPEEAAAVGDFLGQYTQRVGLLLSTCDKCVRNYHMGRKEFLKFMAEEFEEEIVNSLSAIIEQSDHGRIEHGLNKAAALLSALPEKERGMRILSQDHASLTALYEALCCTSYHKSRPVLLLEVMKFVQSVKVLRLGDIVPGMTRFLFDGDPSLRQFALTGYRKAPKKLEKNTFEWVVQDTLVENIQYISAPGRLMEDVERFWQAIVLILSQLNTELITHSLRGLEVTPDIYHLALQHLSSDSDGIVHSILQSFVILLDMAPQAFWSAYGAISPTTVAEQVFNSPAYSRLLAQSQTQGGAQDVPTVVATAWIPAFVRSLPAAQQHDACRSMLSNLLTRYQSENLSQSSRLACCQAGLTTLSILLTTYTTKGYTINTSTSFIMINNVLGLVDKFKDTIVGMATLPKGAEGYMELAGTALVVVRNALLLDCSALKAEFLALENDKPVDHGLDIHSESIWKTLIDSFHINDMDLASTILQGITPLIGLEAFIKPKSGSLSAAKERFNTAFCQLTEIIACVFERISDFSRANLKILYTNTPSAQPLLAGLTSAHEPTYDAAVELVKTLTDGDSRKDAISIVLAEVLDTTLNALASAAKRINEFRTFAAVPNVLKTGKDVLDGLCNAQSGVLRKKSAFTRSEQAALRFWWIEQWRAISTSFLMVEQWSRYHDNDILTNFCRDAMEYAEALFEQFNVIATVLSTTPQDTRDGSSLTLATAQRIVLDQPYNATSSLVKWLRLKDQYLLSTVVSLLGKILRRLGQFDIVVHKDSSTYIHSVINNTNKTLLTATQKAELRKALEENYGIEEVEKPSIVPKKQGTIESWSKSANGVKYEPLSMSRSSDGRQSVINVESWKSRSDLAATSIDDDVKSLSKSLDQGKSTLEQIRARQQAKPAAVVSVKQSLTFRPHETRPGESLKQSRQREKEEKRQRDAAAVAHAKALRAPTIVNGEGSGLKGLGVIGKDHAPIKGEMMVSSDEESDEDEEDTKTLIRKTKDGFNKASELEAARRRAMIKPQGPVKKTKIIRSAKDMRARLIPDMTTLHSNILKWDIFHDGDAPPDGIDCVRISDTFQTSVDYQKSFYPLLISEAWRSLRTARDETTAKPFDIAIATRMSVDAFYEVSTTMTPADNREASLGEGDIVVLSKGQEPLRDKNAPHCLARVYRINRKKDVVEVSYRINLSAISGQSALNLAPNTKVRGFKISSITPIEREYAALKSLEYYDLCAEILQAEPSPLLNYQDSVLAPIQQIYGLNRGQAKAIWSAKENDAFTLIQGPPGSGKTKTIVAMVGAILTSTFVSEKDAQGVAVARPVQAMKTTAAIPKKLLVCAPSNAAVDELVSRLKEGVKDLKGKHQKINVLRLGRSDAINANVRDVTLDALVDARIEADNQSGKGVVPERQKLHQQAGKLKEELAVLRPQLDEARTKGDKTTELRIQREIDGKKRDQARIGAKIDEDKDNGNTVARDNEINRRRIQQEIINGAHVLCATLSGSGHEMFKNLSVEFETVIIDEAAQSIELSALIPLKYGCSKCILVGDPNQLPPTVLSRVAASFGYDQSLFVRMQHNHPDRIHLLDTQYRMHPEISLFPSKSFYEGKLVDGAGLTKLRSKPWHSAALLGPYRFFDVRGNSKQGASHSLSNQAEIDVALQLYERLKREFGDMRNKVGIITPYKGQLKRLREALKARYGDDILDEIDTNTTDAFQGREAEIIIFSCVRADPNKGVGFLSDVRRMNVGLTRAKSSLWVLGDSRSLEKGEVWRELIRDAKERDRYTEGDILGLLRKPLKKAAPMKIISPITDISMKDVDSSQEQNRRTSSTDIQMTDAPPIKDERRSSSSSSRNPSATHVPSGVASKTAGKDRPSLPVEGTLKSLNRANCAQQVVTAPKRHRELSPSDEGPPKKMPAIVPPGLRIPGQPKPPHKKVDPRLPNHNLSREASSDGGPAIKATEPTISTLAPDSKPRPKIIKRRVQADPFLSSKPRRP